MQDRFNDGSDTDGFFITSNRRRFAPARRLIRAYDRHLAAGGDDRFEELLNALAGGDIYEIAQDSKHLAWEIDMVRLAFVGVRLECRSERNTADGLELTFRVSRSRAPKHGRPARRGRAHAGGP
jgi:hypothetical protein